MKISFVKVFKKLMIAMLCLIFLLSVIAPIVNYAEEQKSTVIVKYQDKDGNAIAEEESIQGNIGEKYEVKRKNIEGYKAYGVTPKDAKGTYTEEDIEVIFVYQNVKDEEVVVKYIDKEGYYIRRDKTISGYVGDTYETTADNVDGYKLVKTTGKEKGEIEKEGKEIIYTYKVYDKNAQKTEWTTTKTLTVIAIIVVALIVVFVVIAKFEKKNKTTDSEDKSKNSEE